MRTVILFVIALAWGGLITYVDSRPTWDDTGVTVGTLLVISGMFGFVGPKQPWLWALALGVWIPLVGIIRTQNYPALLALIVAFAGAYGGMALRRWLLPANANP